MTNKSVLLLTAALLSCSDGILDTGSDIPGVNPIVSNDSEAETDTGGAPDAPDAGDDTETVQQCPGGYRYWDLCWYLGDWGENCYGVCELRGGYFRGTPSYMGTESQGGSIENCNAVLPRLQESDRNWVIPSQLDKYDLGLGCYYESNWGGGMTYVTSPDFDPLDSSLYARRVCACGERLVPRQSSTDG